MKLRAHARGGDSTAAPTSSSPRSTRLTERNRDERDAATEREVAAAPPPRRHPAARRGAGRPGVRPAGHRAPARGRGAAGDRRRRPRPRAAARRDPARRLPARARPRRRARRRWRSPGSIERAFAERDAGGGAARAGTRSSRPTRASTRSTTARWIKEGGGVLAIDSPTAELRDARAVRVGRRPASSSRATSASRPLISVEKTTLRKAEPTCRRRLAPGRRLHGRGALAQPVARALALRRRRPGPRHRPAPARRVRPDRNRRGGAQLPGLADQGRGAPPATRRSSARSSSRATRCSSTRSASTRPRRTRRCPTRGSRSRTGSSAARPSRREFAPLSL